MCQIDIKSDGCTLKWGRNHLILVCHSQTNTFQAILAISNASSFAILQYADGLIQWPLNGAQVGFNAGNNMRFLNIPGSRTPNIINITSMSNVGVSGQWVFLISQGKLLYGCMYEFYTTHI